MTTQLHDIGEEFILDESFGGGTGSTSVFVGLYNDGNDSLSDASDVGDITTEPSGSNYTRQSVALDTGFTIQDNGDWEAILNSVTYDTTDSNQSVDAYFVGANFSSDDTGTSGDHLLFTGSLDQTYDLSSVDEFTLNDSGLSIN